MTKQLWQFNESPQRLNDIAREVVSLRRENRFLKVGLIFCLVLSALPYLTGFQPTVIRASKVVTERIEFVRDGKTMMSISLIPKSDGLVIRDRDELPAVGITRDKDGGLIGVYGKGSELVAGMMASPLGGIVSVRNNDNKVVALMTALPDGGGVSANNNDSEPVAVMGAHPLGGSVYVCDSKGNPLASVEATLIGGKLELKTPSGRTVWSAP
jgi:hypothetical protein